MQKHARVICRNRAFVRRAGLIGLSLLCTIQSAALAQVSSSPIIRLEDATEAARIRFDHQDGSSGQQYLVELMGAGVALFDFDQDGWSDVFLLNGSALPGASLEDQPREALYRNNHDGTFTAVAHQHGANDVQYSLGVAVGDYDNDGFEDIYLSNFGPKSLLHNNGDGTFSNLSAQAGVSDGNKFGAGTAFLDIDADGDLDLFAANYVEFSFARHATLVGSTFPYPPGPQHYPYSADTLFRNEGDGTFVDISQIAGITEAVGPSMGVVCGDFDVDGDTDIFVGCDARPNHLFVNDGRGVFREQALLAGVAFDSQGQPVGSMGAETADIDNDGLEDLFVTDYSAQLPLMFRNLGALSFEDVSRSSRAGGETLPHAKWSAGLVDLDNDGDRDLFICQGHLLKNAAKIEQLTAFRVPNCLMVNDGRGRFVNGTSRAGSGLEIVESTRGAGFDDLDNDGDIDAVLLNCAGPANLLRNETSSLNHWIEIELRGRHSNRSAVGSSVKVFVGKSQQVAEVHAGRSYQSHYGSRLHFGLRSDRMVDRLEIHWHSGQVQVLENLSADQRLQVVEPSSLTTSRRKP